MLRRRSLSVQPTSPSESLTNRSSSFTLRSSRRDEGDVFCRDAPIFVNEASPRRPTKTRFRLPGVGMIRAGLAGFRRQKQISLKKQCVWVDTPKEELLDMVHKQRAKSTTALRDRPVDRDVDPTEDLDILIKDGIFHLPRTGPLQRSMFTLSRVRESEMTDRTLDNTDKIKMRSSASSMANMTPRRPPRSHRGSSVITSGKPFSPGSTERDNEKSSIEEIPETTVDRPATRLDSRLRNGQGSQIVRPESDQCSDHVQPLLNSFRSDQVLFHNSLGYKQLRLDTGLVLTGRSEENACIGKRSSVSERRSSDLRRVKFHGNEIPKDVASEVEDSQSTAESISEIEVQSESDDDSQGDDCSVMEQPHSLSTWLDWLEERSNITRKATMYRMKCQQAFLHESQEQLRSHAISADALEDVWQPKMKDRLAVLQRCCIERVKKPKAASRALGIDDDEITDINLDDAEDAREWSRPRLSLNLVL